MAISAGASTSGRASVTNVVHSTPHVRPFITRVGQSKHHTLGNAFLPILRVETSLPTPFSRRSKRPLHVAFAQKVDKKPSKKSPRSNNNGSSLDGDDTTATSSNTKLIATLSVAGGVALLVVGGILAKDQIRAFLEMFIDLVDDWGPLGYLAYIGVYAALELLAVPAIPLTMTAGIIFGVIPGTAVVSVAATAAATGAFLIARYVARDKVLAWASKNPKFAAIDRAIGRDGFRVVALLRLSPLLPLAASNYLYGLTSVDLGSYVLGSWIGMFPGTVGYVVAGTYGKEFLLGGSGDGAAAGAVGAGFQPWQIALALGFTLVAVAYVGNIAKKALAEVEAEINGDE